MRGERQNLFSEGFGDGYTRSGQSHPFCLGVTHPVKSMPSRPASWAEPGERPSFDLLAGPVLEPKALNPVQLPWIRAGEQNSPSGLLLWPNSHFHSVSAQTLCPAATRCVRYWRLWPRG